MDYMTKHYKNLCETIQEKIDHMEKLLEVVVADQEDRGLNPENFKGLERMDDRFKSPFKRTSAPMENDNPIDDPDYTTPGGDQSDTTQNVNPTLDDRYTSPFAKNQNTLGLPPMKGSRPQQSLADKLFGKPLNEITAYSDEERSDPVRKAKEFRDAARLLKIAKAHNLRSRSGFPDQSNEFGERLTQMLRAKGIDAEVEKDELPPGSGRIRSSRISAPHPVDSYGGIEETEPGKFSEAPRIRVPIDQLPAVGLDDVPYDNKSATRDRSSAAFMSKELMRRRRERINSENARIAAKNAYLDKKRSWVVRMDDTGTGSSASN